MAAFINLIGTAVPNVRIAQGVLAKFMKDNIPFSVKESHHLDLLYKASGIQFRHSIIDDFKNGNSSRFFNEKAETDLQNRMRLYEVEAPKLKSSPPEMKTSTDGKGLSKLGCKSLSNDIISPGEFLFSSLVDN